MRKMKKYKIVRKSEGKLMVNISDIGKSKIGV